MLRCKKVYKSNTSWFNNYKIHGKSWSFCLSSNIQLHASSIRNLYIWGVWDWENGGNFKRIIQICDICITVKTVNSALEAFLYLAKTRPWNRAIHSLLSFTTSPITKLQSAPQRSKKHERQLCEWLINMEKIISWRLYCIPNKIKSVH